jgi:hypothetical protein
MSASSACLSDFECLIPQPLEQTLEHGTSSMQLCRLCHCLVSPFVMACIPGPNIQSKHVRVNCCQRALVFISLVLDAQMQTNHIINVNCPSAQAKS